MWSGSSDVRPWDDLAVLKKRLMLQMERVLVSYLFRFCVCLRESVITVITGLAIEMLSVSWMRSWPSSI